MSKSELPKKLIWFRDANKVKWVAVSADHTDDFVLICDSEQQAREIVRRWNEYEELVERLRGLLVEADGDCVLHQECLFQHVADAGLDALDSVPLVPLSAVTRHRGLRSRQGTRWRRCEVPSGFRSAASWSGRRDRAAETAGRGHEVDAVQLPIPDEAQPSADGADRPPRTRTRGGEGVR